MEQLEIEKRKRINVALYAYAYEIMGHSLVSDEKYDTISLGIRPKLPTNYPIMDNFFKNEFSPDTGMWIYKHPELEKIAQIYSRLTHKQHIMPKTSINTKIPITSASAAAIKAGFNTNRQMKLYMSSLGMKVLSDSSWKSGYGRIDFEYDYEFVHIYQHDTGMKKTVFCTDAMHIKDI